MLQLKLFGKPTAVYKEMSNMLENVINATGKDCKIEQVHDVDSFIEYEIQQIPTIYYKSDLLFTRALHESKESFILRVALAIINSQNNIKKN